MKLKKVLVSLGVMFSLAMPVAMAQYYFIGTDALDGSSITNVYADKYIIKFTACVYTQDGNTEIVDFKSANSGYYIKNHSAGSKWVYVGKQQDGSEMSNTLDSVFAYLDMND